VTAGTPDRRVRRAHRSLSYFRTVRDASAESEPSKYCQGSGGSRTGL
jgi:hypothetical protein